MERLTQKDWKEKSQGGIPWSVHPVHHIDDLLYYKRLAAYEDTGFTPEQVVEMAKELAELKKQLPLCKVGDTVYYPDNEHYFIVIPIKISEIVIGILDSVQYNGCFFDGNGDPETEFEFDNNDFGKTVFLTKEETEEKLKEMEDK